VIEGRPFVGDAGRRLNKALSLHRVQRSGVYVTNTVLCHPVANQSPPPTAVKACHERLIAEIRQRMPMKVMGLGGTAAEALTGDSRAIEQRRGLPAPFHYLGAEAEVRVTYHPSPLSLNTKPGRSEQFDEDIGWLADP
jgi:uracil-DNA glycosylase